MKKRVFAGLVATLLIPVPAALAESGAREDSSGIVVWVFLGICALIVVAQLVPAAMVMLGLVKGVTEKKEQSLQKPSR